MQRMHQRRRAEEAAVKERRVRRRRLLMQAEATADAAETDGLLNSVVQGLQRESAEEARIGARLKQLAAEEAVLVDNRNQRLAQYTERREKDWAEALAREVELSQALKAQVSDEVERERREWRRAQARRQAEKQAKHELMARGVVRDLVGLALLHAEHREQCGLQVPPKVSREWTAMFHAQDVRLRSWDEQVDVEAAKIVDDTVDGATLRDYLYCEGEWDVAALAASISPDRPNTTASRPSSGQTPAVAADAAAAGEPIGFNEPLSAAVHTVRERVHPPPADAAPTLDLPVRIAVVGGPFCGKTTLAQGLAESYNAAVLDAEVLVNNAVQAAGVYLDPEPQIIEEEVECVSDEEEPAQTEPGTAGLTDSADALSSTEASGQTPTDAAPAQGAKLEDALPETVEQPEGTAPEGQGDMSINEATQQAKSKRTKIVTRVVDPPLPPRQVLIGRRAVETLLDGEQLSDADTAALVADAIMNIQHGYTTWKTAADESGAPAVDSEGKPTNVQGFILDGFPRTAQQAQELEKALTGLDMAAEEAYVAGASFIAPPSSSAFLSPTRPIKSCLDSVVVLELENSEVAVERAVGRRMDPETGKIYHMQLSPPPGDAPGLLERLIPVSSQSNDTEQLQKRLQVHVDTAPGLRAWLRRFDRLVWMVSADVAPDKLLAEVRTIAASAQEGKAAAAQCAAAARAAQGARETAEGAQARAQEAMQAASAAARELLLAKRAEVEAEALVRKPPTPDPKAAKGGKKPTGDVEVDPETKKAEDAAAALLATQAGERCAEHLRQAERASAEAQTRADEAAVAAKAASEACAEARRSAHDAAKSREAEERAAAAAKAAEAAMAATEVAAQTAAASASAAAAAVANAQARAAGAPEDLPTAADLVASSADPADPAAAAETSAASAESQEELTKAFTAETYTCPLDPESARYLHELWTKTEATYVRGAKLSFAGLRRLRSSVLERLHAAQVQFASHIKRPDSRQAELTKFQVQFNAVDLDLLRLPEVKAELALQVDELRDRLWKVCDEKLADNTKLHVELTAPDLEGSFMAALASGYAALVQAEADRFRAAAAFARDHAARSAGLPLLGTGAARVDILGEDDGPLAPFMPAAGTCEWAAVGGLEHLTRALRRACAVRAQDERETIRGAVEAGTAAARPPSAQKGKKGAPPPPAEPVPPTASAAAAAAAAAMPDCVARADALALPLVEREREILMKRLRAIATRAQEAAAELRGVMNAVSTRLEELMHARFRAECASVASVTYAAAEAVQAGELLPHALVIPDGESAVIDESTIIVPQPPRKPPVTPVPKPLAPGLLNPAQIAALVRAVRAVTTCEFVTTCEAADLLQGLSAVQGDVPEAFPPEWRGVTWKQMHDALAELDGHASGYVDWLEVTTALVLQACPQIADAPPKAFAAAAATLAEADGDGDGAVTEGEWKSCQLWFEAQRRRPGCDDDLEAANALPAEPAEEAADWHQPGIKQILWNMFCEEAAAGPPTTELQHGSRLDAVQSMPAGLQQAGGSSVVDANDPAPQSGQQVEPSGSMEQVTSESTHTAADASDTNGALRRLNINRMLLYLCADKELPLAMRKAFAVLSRDASPRTTLAAPEVVHLLYPSGTATGARIFKVPYSEHEVCALLREAQPGGAEPAAPEQDGAAAEAEVRVTADQVVYSMPGSRLLAACGQRYHLRDTFLACWSVMPALE
eukprot:jgi/Ulvmu1/12340/UM089_0024.1